jgi:deoxyadenosine/deoxycytidine kinase
MSLGEPQRCRWASRGDVAGRAAAMSLRAAATSLGERLAKRSRASVHNHKSSLYSRAHGRFANLCHINAQRKYGIEIDIQKLDTKIG